MSGEGTSISSMGSEQDSCQQPYNYKARTITTTLAPHLSFLQLSFTNHIAFSYILDSNDRSWLYTFDIDWDRGRFSLWLILSWILSSLFTTKVRSALDLSAKIKLLIPNRNGDTHHKLFNYLSFGCIYEFGLFSDSPKPLLIVCIFDLNPPPWDSLLSGNFYYSSPFFRTLDLCVMERFWVIRVPQHAWSR